MGTKPAVDGNFFWKYNDGSSNAYCTFMGGDTRATHVSTPTKNGRRLLIIKDSFGNAIASFLILFRLKIYMLSISDIFKET